MDWDRVIYNGTVVNDDGMQRADIYIRDGRVAAVTSERRSQVGTGMRNERIRTYNFPQNRVSDHRIELTLYRLDAVMNGELDLLIEPLLAHEQAEKLQNREYPE